MLSTNPFAAADDAHNMSLHNIDDPFATRATPPRAGLPPRSSIAHAQSSSPFAAEMTEVRPPHAASPVPQRSATQVSFVDAAEVVATPAARADPASPSNPPTQAAAETLGSRSPKTPRADSERTTVAGNHRSTPRRPGGVVTTPRKPRTPCRMTGEARSVLAEEPAAPCCGAGGLAVLSQFVEDVAFSASCRVYVLFLLLSQLLFVVLAALRLLSAVWVHMFLVRDDVVWGVASAVLSFHLVATFAATAIDLNLRLIRSWARLAPDTVHVFYLPNAEYTRRAVDVRNAHLGVLLLATLVVPLVAAIVHCCVDGSAFPFVGVFAFYGFCAINTVVALVYVFMLWTSLANKYRTWQSAAELRDELLDCDDDEDAPWRKRVAANPLAMSEFGLDMLSVRTACMQICLLVVWALVMVSVLGVAPEGQMWLVVVVAVLLGAFTMALTVAKPGSKASKTARRQRRTTYIALLGIVVFVVLGVLGAAVRGAHGMLLAQGVLLLLTQGGTVRRHDLHVNDGFAVAEDDDEDDEQEVTRWLPVLPFAGLLRACASSTHACTRRTARRVRARREQEVSIMADHHCAALERKLDATQRVLTADARISVWLLLAAAAVLLVGVHVGGWYDDDTHRAVQPVVRAANTSSSSNSSSADYAVCDMSWNGVDIADLAVLTLLAKHGELAPAPLQADAAAALGAAWNVTAVVSGAAEHRASWVHYAHLPSGMHVVAATAPADAAQWAHDIDVWGDDVVLALLQALNPFTAVWAPVHKRGLVHFLAGAAGALGTSAACYTEDLRAYVRELPAANVVLTGHAMQGGHLLMHGPADIPTVAFGAPGSHLAGPAQALAVNIQPEGALLSRLHAFSGFTQLLPCDGSATQCQQLTASACEVVRGCGGARPAMCD